MWICNTNTNTLKYQRKVIFSATLQLQSGDWDKVVSKVTNVDAGKSGAQIPARAKDFFSNTSRQGLGGNPGYNSVSNGASFPEG